MKEYGILSLNINQKDNNWGSILQSWALQEVLEKKNIGVKIVNYCPACIIPQVARNPIKRRKGLKGRVRYLINDIIEFKSYVIRDNKFKQFIKQYYKTTQYFDPQNIDTLEMDGYIVGSDIVWDNVFWDGFDNVMFCNLPNMKNKLNVSYAPSMSDNAFDKENEACFERLLANFNSISVREKSKQEYVQKFTEKKVVQVVDPTLLLEEKDYAPITAPPLTQKYVLLYTIFSDVKLNRIAVEYAKRNQLKIVRVKCLDYDRMMHPKWKTYNDAGIEEWLSLVKNATCIFTNSFHCCNFSVIFHKEFYATYRYAGKNKIIDLLEMLGLNNRLLSQENEKYKIISDKDIDYEEVERKLVMHRKSSLEYLMSALKEEK